MDSQDKCRDGVVRRLKLGNRGKLVAYLTTWALVGIILLAIPTLVSPFAQRTLTAPSPTNLGNQGTTGTNNITTTTYPFKIDPNGTVSVTLKYDRNQTLLIDSAYPTNITIATWAGATNVLTISSSTPANVTVTSRQSAAEAGTTAPLSNLPDFALRLSLVIVPAAVLSSLGMFRMRRRFRTEFATDAD